MTIRRHNQALLGALLLVSALCATANTAGTLADNPKLLTAQAVRLDHGTGVPTDFNRAAELYCRAARIGYAPAQYYLGWMYVNGRGLARDKAAAAALFALAAKQGHSQAQNMLSLTGGVKGILPACMRDEVVESGLFNSPERRSVVKIVKRLAPKFNVKPLLALAIISAESNFDPNAISAKNAQGLMQLIPDTAARFNIRNSFDPTENIRGGLTYLRWLLAYYQGDVALVAAGYNAGEKVVDRYRGVPPYPETRNYVKRVLQIVKQNQHPYDASVTSPSPGFANRMLIQN